MKFFVALAGAVLGQVWHASAAAEVEMDVAPDVEIIQRPTLLYSNISPKLRIQGKGFGKNADEIKLPFTPPLSKKGKPIYNISVTDTVLSLGLKKGESWPTSSSGSATLFLQSIIVDKHGPQNQLESAVPVATVIEPPSVVRGEDKVIYMTGTPRFLINGTGFRDGTTTLTFDPPLVRDVDYVLAVRSPTVLQLALKTGRKWRVDGEPGPLRLRRIDSGAGALRIDPKFGGVTVAEVQADLGGHGVSAVGNPTMLIYQNTASVVVKGAGFDHANQVEGFGAPRMRWGNGLLGRGVNFTVSTFDDARVELVLKPGSLWRRNGANLPAPLTLLACDVGSGYVAIGATEAKKGIRVATVFESPAVTPQPLTSLFRTHSAQLWVTGVGFTRAGAAGGLGAEMKLEFEPALRVGVDYTLTVFNRTHALVRLREGRAWAAAPGPLYVTGCDAGAGPYANFKPAAVAHVLPDAAAHESGVEVTRTNHQVLYQTPAIRHLEIHGSSLSQDSKLAFNPPLVKNVDYKVLRATTDVMILALLAGKMWRKTPGQLTLLSVDTGKGDVDMAHGTGIVVADIAANPTVATSTARVTASTTRRLSIYGTGFSIDGTELTLEPTSRSAYDVEAVYENEVVLRLREGKSWGVVPKDAKEAMPLVVTKIDTAAGEYIFQDGAGAAAPVVVAMIVQDSAATGANGDVLRCDDTCMWANDGVCDDGSQDGGGGGEGEGKGGGAWWEDDDLGGWYSDEREGGGDGGDGDGGDEYDYGYEYDDSYGYYGDDAAMPACIAGTDCTDCGGPLAASASSGEGEDAMDLKGDWDDDEWFDDDTEEWWDDDYDFGEEWDGFEDDEKEGDGPVGIIQSVHPTRKPNKRHSGKGRGKRGQDEGGAFDPSQHPALVAAFVLAAAAASFCACAGLFKKPKTGQLAADEEPCCSGKRKQAQA
mmetsp:Transcript_19207/g.66181  ORF Transcript_19207/g.66181 Transcript_19207/m.66181 type:complete len:931 (-) Transcript_19207:139-2931(-)